MKSVSTFAYRVRRRLLLEVRQRTVGVYSLMDGLAYRAGRSSGSGVSRDRCLRAGRFAPWAETDGLPSVTGDECAGLLAAADDVCGHRFDLLGSGLVELGPVIDWHRDFKSGYRWETGCHHSRIKWADLPPGVDIKVPWELSRCMHFATLGLADALRPDSRYYSEFKAQVRHWIVSNPVDRGVNWTCAMDVALRAANWINALFLFQGRIRDDGDHGFFDTLCEALWMAGVHIFRNLEWQGPHKPGNGNHFLANITGLLALGLFFQDTRQGRKWFRFGRHWMEKEIQCQINPDGSNFETSINYHRLVMEMFLWAASLCQRAGTPFPAEYVARLRKMEEFVAAYTSPSGVAPQFGDNDSGRVLCAGIGDAADHRYLRGGPCGFGGLLDRWLLRGGMPEREVSPEGRGFPDGGYWFGGVGDAWLGVRAGPVSHHGVHAHCDQLAVVLSVAGREILVDRGTGVYTPAPEIRNRFRSTRYHNSPVLNGWEQNSFGTGRNEVFSMADDTRTTVDAWQSGRDRVCFSGCHSGFSRMREGVVCRRNIGLEKGRMTIEDSLEGLIPGDRLEWCFHLAPGASVRQGEQGFVISAGNVEVRMKIPAILGMRIESCDHSSGYGCFEPARMIHLLREVLPESGDAVRLVFEWQDIPVPDSGAAP